MFSLIWGDKTSNLGALRTHWPQALEHARGDALASHHADDPDAADATDGWLRRRGATPSSLTFKHQLLSLWTFRHGLLDHPVPLWAFTSLSILMQIRFILHIKHTSEGTYFLTDTGLQSLTSCMCSAMRHPPTFLSLEMKRKVLVLEGHLVSTCWKPRSLSTTSLISSTWETDSEWVGKK